MKRHKGRRPIGRMAGALVAVVCAVALLSGAPTTGAYWADESPAPAGSLTSGTLDLKLRPGISGTYTDSITVPAASLSGMLPGDSRAFNFGLVSDGIEAPMTYEIYGRTTPSAAPNQNVLPNALQTQIWITNGTAANPGNATNGYRTDQFGTAYGASCPSGAQIGLQTTLSVASDVLLTASGTNPVPTLQPDDTNNLCVRVSLPNGVAGTARGKSTTITLTVIARSVER